MRRAKGKRAGAGDSLSSVTLVILAGGMSRRMGSDKAAARLGGRTLLEHMLANLAGPFGEEIVSVRDGGGPPRPGVRVVEDVFAGAGPLAGLHAALRGSRTRWNFCAACDMPFLSSEVARALLEHAGSLDEVQAVVPRLPQGIEPLAALYRKDCWRVMERTLEAGGRKIVSALADLRITFVEGRRFEGGDELFFNVNTKEGLEEAEARLRGGRRREA